MTEASKENPAPLDAFETAKPDEPIFTLQGGDPLAGPLVRLWSYLARIRAGIVPTTSLIPHVDSMVSATREHCLSHDEREQTDLLIRATAAEEVSWAMDRYVKGAPDEVTKPSKAADPTVDSAARIDLHDYRVRSAQKISGMVADLTTIVDELHRRGHYEGTAAMAKVAWQLRNIGDSIEPRQMMKRTS
jgi:hypothetical protein